MNSNRFTTIMCRSLLFLLAFLCSWSPLHGQNTSRRTEQWFFDRPAIDKLQQAKRKVFAHYFSPFPVSIDNKPAGRDYYTREYLSVDGEGGKHRKYGGYLRQRPLPRPPRSEPNWKELDMMREVRLAVNLGLDGFCYDILSTQGVHWQRLKLLLDAAQKVDPDFKIMLMPDMMAEFRNNPDRMVPAILEVAGHPSVLRDEKNHLILSAFNAQTRPPSWWKNALSELKQNGVDVKFVPVFQAWWEHASDYEAISYGFSDWGAGTVSGVLGRRRTSPQQCHERGKLWMAPIRPQDYRPKSSVVFEASNTELFRSMWKVAIEGNAEWAQIITWNDYSEGTEIAPSTETKRLFYDLTAYYTTWFKQGRPPAINRDAIYYCYRIQSTEASPDPDRQPEPVRVVGEPSNQIELLAFLTEPGTLEIEIGGEVSRKKAQAGMTSFRVPLTDGTPEFRLRRNGKRELQLKGSRSITTGNVTYQDLLYRGGGVVKRE